MPTCKKCNRERKPAQMHYSSGECRTCARREYNRKYKRKYMNEYVKNRIVTDYEFRLKIKARRSISNALRNNKIVKPIICENCLENNNIEAHHENYMKPLDVKWFCRKCHISLHQRGNNDES